MERLTASPQGHVDIAESTVIGPTGEDAHSLDACGEGDMILNLKKTTAVVVWAVDQMIKCAAML